MKNSLLRILLFSAITFQSAVACLWDSDTLAMERKRFPQAQELIAGHFVRHSQSYYQWRIDDRLKKPLKQRTPMDFDDIAVAYDKIGNQVQAIATIQTKLEKWPNNHLYESHANLGTFFIHAGKFEEGIQHIAKAIEINPDAHFGREIYQKLLVEYLIQMKGENDAISLPLNPNQKPFQSVGFAEFVLKARKPAPENEFSEIQSAVKGVLGMMRFGNFQSPILLEVLGDLLLANHYKNDSKMLAARAYLKASYEVSEDAARTTYRKKAEDALKTQRGFTLDDIEFHLKKEIHQADIFFTKLTRAEKAWIDAGKDVDKEFAKKYYKEPNLKLQKLHWPINRGPIIYVALSTVLALLLIATFFIIKWIIGKLKKA